MPVRTTTPQPALTRRVSAVDGGEFSFQKTPKKGVFIENKFDFAP